MPLASARFVEVFCTIVEAGSFTHAAKELGLTPAAVSRAVAKHEERMGVELFRRTTRSMKLTDDGAAYFEKCRQALSLLEAAERELGREGSAPRGLIRISVPTTWAHFRLMPIVARFREAHPAVSFELHVANRNIDFVAEGYDMAIRAGELEDSTLVVRKLEDAPLGLYASPAYLARRGTPKAPADLERHTMIGFIRPSTGRALSFLFQERDGTRFEIPPGRTLLCSDDFLGCVTLARAGAGVAQIYHYIVEADVARGDLVEVLRPFAGASRPFSLLMPARRATTLAVRMFAEELVAAMRAQAGRSTRAEPARAAPSRPRTRSSRTRRTPSRR
jgi:DNA-binding transcriptional LysR family regulator